VRFVTAQSSLDPDCAVCNRTYKNHHTLFCRSKNKPE